MRRRIRACAGSDMQRGFRDRGIIAQDALTGKLLRCAAGLPLGQSNLALMVLRQHRFKCIGNRASISSLDSDCKGRVIEIAVDCGAARIDNRCAGQQGFDEDHPEAFPA